MVAWARAKGVEPSLVSPDLQHDSPHRADVDHHHALKANLPRDPTAMLPYVDHDDSKKAADNKLKEQLDDGRAMAIGTHLVLLSRNMSDTSSRAFIHELDKIDSPALRKKVLAQFEAQTGQSIQAFIESCDDWNNNGENRDKKAALQLVSKERDDVQAQIEKMSPAERQKALDKADEYARQICAATMAHDHSDENVQKIFRALGGRNAVEIELIRQRIREQTDGNTNLYQLVDDGMHEGDEDEAIAMLEGNRVNSARAALANETDPKRLREVLTELSPDELKLLQMGGYANEILIAQIKNPSDREEIRLLIAGKGDEANGERLANLLKPKEEGRITNTIDEVGTDNYKRRKASNVLKEFESMSAEEVRAAAKAWNAKNPTRTFEMMLSARWGNDDDPTEYKRLLAMIEGDKGLNRSLRMQEGIRDEDQEEIEGSLGHQKVSEADLASPDAKVRKRAEAAKAENESFERNNRVADLNTQKTQLLMQGRVEEAMKLGAGRSSKEQLERYYDERAKEDIGTSLGERVHGGEAGELIHKERQRKHDEKVRDDRVGAMELLEDGKLSPETEYHRGKKDKDKNEALETITTNDELKKAQERYKKKYGKEMLEAPTGAREDMNFHELEMDNLRLYGVKGERPARLEYVLQAQVYALTHSDSLERSEASENGGGGTERGRRWSLSAMRKRLKGPQTEIHDPVVRLGNGMTTIVEYEGESFGDFEAQRLAIGDSKEEGLEAGVSKHEFSQLDKNMTGLNKAQQDAKKRLADRIVKIFSTIAKLAALLTANPALLALINVGEGLLEMAIKKQIMGESYDPADDAKMLAFTALAETAMLGVGKLGKMAGAAKVGTNVEHQLALAAKTEAGYQLAGGAAKLAIQQVGHGIVQGKSASEILQGLAAGGAGLMIPGKLAEKIKGAIGDETKARALLAEVMSAGGEFLANTSINVLGGAGGADAAIDAGLGVAGGRLQKRRERKAEKKAANPNEAELAPANAEDRATPTVAHEDNHAPPKAPLDAHALANGHHAEDHAPAKPAHVEDHALANGHHAEDHAPGKPAHVEDHAPKASHASDTEMGSRNPFNAPTKDPAGYRVAVNSGEQQHLASDRVAKMNKTDRARYDAIEGSLENRAARVMVERALAAGHSIDQVGRLRDAMKGLSYQEVLRRFSGDGLAQHYNESCVPTAYQIAIAERDPVYALHLREHPDEMRRGQENALVHTEGRRARRHDAYDAPQAYHDQLRDQDHVRSLARSIDLDGTPGIEPTRMVDTPLHAQLEKTIGTKYEVITNKANPHDHPGAGEFTTFPHDRVGEALARNQPVMYGQGSHERVIIRKELGPDGKMKYVVTDPGGARSYLVDPSEFTDIPVVSITLPAKDAKATHAQESHSTKAPARGEHDGSTLTGSTDKAKLLHKAKGKAQEAALEEVGSHQDALALREKLVATQNNTKLRQTRTKDLDPGDVVQMPTVDEQLLLARVLKEGDVGSIRVAMGKDDSRVVTSLTQMEHPASIQVKGIGTSKEIRAEMKRAANDLGITEQMLMIELANFRATGHVSEKIRDNPAVHALLAREALRRTAVESSRISTNVPDEADATVRMTADRKQGGHVDAAELPADMAKVPGEQHGAVKSDKTATEIVRREDANEAPLRSGTIRERSGQKILKMQDDEASKMDPSLFEDFGELVKYIYMRTHDQLRRTR